MSPRPFELAMAHLHNVIQISRLPTGARLPAAVDLAAELGISQGTVKNVYRQLMREGKVRTRTGDGSFWIGEPKGGQRVYHIGIDTDQIPRHTNPESWLHRIYGGIMSGKLMAALPVQFHTSNLVFGSDGTLENPPEELRQLDGMLLVTLRPHPSDQIRFEGRTIPSIALNPYCENASKNFVSPDYFGASRKVGKIWRQTGRKRILSLLSPGMERSVSVRLRYGGLICGLGLGDGGDVESRYVTAPEGSEEAGYEAVRRFLNEGAWQPDAVYAAGDLLAFGAIRALEERGLRVPLDTSVIGGNGMAFLKYPPRFLTCIEHQLAGLGEAMLRLLIQRIDRHGADVPSHIEISRFIAGTTTRPEENALFEKEP